MATGSTDTKQKLIDTALELLWKNSYGSVSVDDICKGASVKKGSFYHFFPSKLDLTVAAMEENLRSTKLKYDEVFTASRAPLERFTLMADSIYEHQAQAAKKYGHVCGCPCVTLSSEIANAEENVRKKFEDFSHLQRRYYETALEQMIELGQLPSKANVKAKAQDIYAYVLGQTMLARIQNDLAPIKDLKAGLLQTIGINEGTNKAA